MRLQVIENLEKKIQDPEAVIEEADELKHNASKMFAPGIPGKFGLFKAPIGLDTDFARQETHRPT